MDFKKYKDIKEKIVDYDLRLETLHKLEQETLENKQKVQDECSHDFVLAYGLDENGEKKAGCLVCGQYLNINNEFIDSFSDVQLDKESVLDVTLETCEFAQRLMKGNKNVLLIRAEEIFNNYCKINKMSFSRKMILKDIYYKVLELNEYYVSLEDDRKLNGEKEITKKKK